MEYSRRPRSTSPMDVDDADACVYPNGWGNIPDMHYFSSYAPTRDYYQDEGSSGRMRSSHPRHRVTAGPPDHHGAERQPHMMPTRRPSAYPMAFKIGEAFGCKNEAPVEDSGALSACVDNQNCLITHPPKATCELIFEDDPAPYLRRDPPQIPADVDGPYIGRFLGTLNQGRIGGNGKKYKPAACHRFSEVLLAHMVMRYQPQRAATTGNQPSSPVGTYNDSRSRSRSRSRGRHSSHGFTMFPPSSTQTATSTFPAYGQEQSLGQAPNAERYGQNRRSLPPLHHHPRVLGFTQRVVLIRDVILPSPELHVRLNGRNLQREGKSSGIACLSDIPRPCVSFLWPMRMILIVPPRQIDLEKVSCLLLAIAVWRRDVTNEQQAENVQQASTVAFFVHGNIETAWHRVRCRPARPPPSTSLHCAVVLFLAECGAMPVTLSTHSTNPSSLDQYLGVAFHYVSLQSIPEVVPHSTSPIGRESTFLGGVDELWPEQKNRWIFPAQKKQALR
ncbi:hypothetical protein BKA70DRAFT_1234081 [Coprinopsis sp. MPI-PUGE-AT-0042]|nr:hypothetical protein BKA70DRAFT_1234081 [Coprinopsis sp. MPI-PUGE-AT-0042]